MKFIIITCKVNYDTMMSSYSYTSIPVCEQIKEPCWVLQNIFSVMKQ